MEMKVKLQAFNVPDGVYPVIAPRPRQDGFGNNPKISLKDIPEEVLSGLCDQFRKDVFEKAGKKDPKATDILEQTFS